MLNRMMIVAASSAFVLSATTAMSQGIPFVEVDTNADSMLSNEELVAAFGVDGAEILLADDGDGDGMLSIQEIRVTAGMDPAERAESLDTEDPDYRDEETPVNPTTDFGEGFISEEDESEGGGG